MKIALAQINGLVGDIKGNCKIIIESIEKGIKQGADIIIFPELALTGYPPEDLLYRQSLYDETQAALTALVPLSEKITIILGHPRQEQSTRYNSLSVLQDGQLRAVYDKQRLPNYRVFDEKRYFSPGDQPCVIEIQGIHFGLMICEDLWFSDTVAKTHELGAEVLISINASPFHRTKSEERLNIIQQRYQETELPIFYCNSVGGQDELVFDGGSLVIDQEGKLAAKLPEFTPELQIIELSKTAPKLLSIQHNTLAKNQSDEARLYDALVTSVKDYVKKNNFEGAIIGSSGGIDSALTAAIATDALGAQNVETVMMPSEFTSKMSLNDSEQLAKNLSVEYDTIAIGPIVSSFAQALAPVFAGYETDTTEENIQARVRGTLLMAISNKKRKLVLTTGNKSELAVGYCTLYGDMAGGFCVLKDVLKTWVYRLANYRNSISPVIPQRIIDRPPSAELAEDQVDQDTLPDYAVLDDILSAYIEHDQDIDKIIEKGFDANLVERVIKMVRQNEYKRFQAPPGPRVTHRAFGKDWRYPLTAKY